MRTTGAASSIELNAASRAVTIIASTKTFRTSRMSRSLLRGDCLWRPIDSAPQQFANETGGVVNGGIVEGQPPHAHQGRRAQLGTKQRVRVGIGQERRPFEKPSSADNRVAQVVAQLAPVP